MCNVLKNDYEYLVKFCGSKGLEKALNRQETVKMYKMFTVFSMLVTIAEKMRKFYNIITKNNENVMMQGEGMVSFLKKKGRGTNNEKVCRQLS